MAKLMIKVKVYIMGCRVKFSWWRGEVKILREGRRGGEGGRSEGKE